jgi:predicted ABC-class ATPase
VTETSPPIDQLVRELSGAPIAAYNDLSGSYRCTGFTLYIDHVAIGRRNPNARMRVRVPRARARFPKDVFTPRCREIAARDFLTRAFDDAAKAVGARVGRRAGQLSIEIGTREIIEASSVVIGEDIIEARFSAELPGGGSHIHPDRIAVFFMQLIPGTVKASLLYDTCEGDLLADQIECAEDADTLRNDLKNQGLVAFIADGSRLTGWGDSDSVVPLAAPDDLAVTVELPNKGAVRGLGIPKGITVITGGYASGRSTLCSAITRGIYSHLPEDGRSKAVTVPDAITIGAEPGRRIEGIDMSAFFPGGLPGGAPEMFRTESATASEAFAAGVMEAVELGAGVLIVDEDDVPVSLFSGDPAIRDVLTPDDGSAVPLSTLASTLRDDLGISMVVTASAGSEWIAAADTVIVMRDFQPVVITDAAKDAVARHGISISAPPIVPKRPVGRVLLPHSMTAPKENSDRVVKSPGWRHVQYGDSFVSLAGVPQIGNRAQIRGLSRGIALAARLADGSRTLKEVVDMVVERVTAVGLDTLSNRLMGDLATFRAYELAAAINRLGAVKMKQ